MRKEEQADSNNICIFGYGSLVEDIGDELNPLIIKKIKFMSPFKVEYARKSSSRGNAPTLTTFSEGDFVEGKIIVLSLLNSKENLEKIKNMLMEREHTHNENYIRITNLKEFESVLYCEFPSNIVPDSELLAKLAIKSVSNLKLKEEDVDRNGIRYLFENINHGIITQLTKEYQQEILKQTRTSSLEEAEAKLILENQKQSHL